MFPFVWFKFKVYTLVHYDAAMNVWVKLQIQITPFCEVKSNNISNVI